MQSDFFFFFFNNWRKKYPVRILNGKHRIKMRRYPKRWKSLLCACLLRKHVNALDQSQADTDIPDGCCLMESCFTARLLQVFESHADRLKPLPFSWSHTRAENIFSRKKTRFLWRKFADFRKPVLAVSCGMLTFYVTTYTTPDRNSFSIRV